MTKTNTARLNTTAHLAKTAALRFPTKPAAPAPASRSRTNSPLSLGHARNVLKNFAIGAGQQSAPKTRTVELAMPVVLDQGNTNGCGTNSLANVLNYFNGGNEAQARALQQKADRAIRNGDMFTAPDDLIRFAEANGYRAEMKTDASLSDITRMIDQGVPVQVLIDSGSRGDFAQHYVAVVGYEKDAAGNVTSLKIADSAYGKVRTMSAADFMDKWTDLPMAGVSTGMSRVMFSYVPKGDRPIKGADGVVRRACDINLPSNGTWDMFSNSQPGRAIGQGINNIVNGWHQKDPAKILGGVVTGLAGAGGQILGIAGHYGQKWGRGAQNWGMDKIKNGNVLEKIGGVFAVAGGGILRGAGWAVQKVGNVVAWAGRKVGDAITEVGGKIVSGVKKVGKAIGKGAKKVGTAVKDGAKAVGNAVASGAKAVGKGIKKVFSGW